MKHPRRLENSRGVTLVELMIVMTVLSIMAVAVTPLFNTTQQGYSAMEAHALIKGAGESTLNVVQHTLTESKRLFENNANDALYVAKMQRVLAPPLLAGSTLPTIEENGSISPSTSSFVAAGVGNWLFFASLGQTFALNVLDSGSVVRSVRIDSYLFNAYYLATDGNSLGLLNELALWEWHSPIVADYNQIMAISDVTKRNNVVTNLVSSGTTEAWDPSQTNPNNAFYALTSGGGIALDSGYTLAEKSAKQTVKISAVINGFYYGVCPNTSSTTFVCDHQVPEFGTASGIYFPSGFEIVVVGPNSDRQVFIRLVLVAQGAFKKLISHEQILLATVRDLW